MEGGMTRDNAAIEETLDPESTRARLVAWFENTESTTVTERSASERDRDYYDGIQLTAAEEAAMRARGQPPLVLNHVRGKVNYLLGLEKRARQDPKAYPRNPQDDEDANAATDAIRFVCDENEWPGIASAVWENMLIEGYGAAEVVCEKDAEDYRVTLRHIPWHRTFIDPFSSRADASDAKFLGTVAWMDEDDILARYPDASEVIEQTYMSVTPGAWGDTYDDRPAVTAWADPRRKRVRVVQMWWREAGVWHVAMLTSGGFLEEPMPSPYTDEHGRPECGLIIQAAYVDRKNRRYGVVRDMIGAQDEINKRRSKALHLLSVRQVVAEQGAVQDVDAARQELAKPDGYVEVAPGMRFDINPTGDLANGQVQLLQEAKQELAAMGPNAAMQGRAGASSSGRAIALSQQGGVVEIDGAVLDQHRMFKRRVYRAIWNRVRQFWTAEKWVRVTDDERNVRFVGFNTPRVDPNTGAPMLEMDPTTGAFRVAMQNVPAQMWVDIVVEEAPDVATLQQEQFAALAEFARAMPGVIPPALLIKASSLRNKDELLELLEQAPPPPNPALIETQRKAQRDQGDLALGAARLELDAQKAQAEALGRMAVIPPAVPWVQ